jgi:hypothetical protein
LYTRLNLGDFGANLTHARTFWKNCQRKALVKTVKKLLIMELKKSLVSDFTIGQVLRYMSDISDEIADN